MKRSAIPTPPPGYPDLREMLTAVKENIELLTGVRGTKLTPLQSNATLADVIATVNKIVDRLS
jgi:hypothetical protein